MNHGNAVGLDYHTESVQVAVMDADGQLLGNRKCCNDWGAIRAAAEGYGAVGRVAIEACGGSADLAEELVQQAGWHVELAHPGYVARMKQTPDKSDFTDAQLLADLTRVGYLPKVWLAPQPVRELRALVRYRASLVEDGRRAKQRIGSILREQRVRNESGASRWTKRWLAWLTASAPLSEQGKWVVAQHLRRIERLKEDLAAVHERLKTLTADDPMVHRLLAEPGVGEVTAWTIRAEIGRFDRFNSGKQVSRFAGLTPRNASSGQRQADAGLIKAGNRLLRATLVQLSHRLIRNVPRWRQLATKMLAAGKPKSVIVAAVANRWLRRLYYAMAEATAPPGAASAESPGAETMARPA